MAYTDFTFDSLRHAFGMQFRDEKMFGDAPPVAPSPWLLDTLQKAKALGFNSEKSRSERLVTPVLIELSAAMPTIFPSFRGPTSMPTRPKG